jgi:hypothetical protein
LNLGEIRSEVKSNLGNRADITDARYNLWINLTETELASAFPFFQNATKGTWVLTVGTATYSLTSKLTDFLALYSVKDMTVKRRIKRTGFRKIDNIDETLTGDPTHYIRFGDTIQFVPVPSAANTVQCRYGKTLTAMSGDNDTPTITLPWHEALVLGATLRGWRALKQYEEMALWKNEYLGFVRSREAEWETEEWDEEFGLELMR